VITFEKAGHWVHHDQLDAFIDAVRTFLAAP
jgi:pimeloyl-ACP methyl ester carboxylesterase